MTRNRIYGLIGIGVAGVGAAILFTTGSFSGSAGLNQSVEAPSAPALPDTDDSKVKRAASNPMVRQKANAPTVSLVLEKGDTIADRTLTYFRYNTSDGFTGYFDAGGNSVQASLIKTPVEGGKLSSLFGKREHPILGYTRMHKGLDFVASLGTLVLAAGDGVVTVQARKGSFGKYASIRHDNEISTAYAHLSKYRDTIGPGRRVRQGDVIGYVGATGLATGPNRHFEVLRDGRQVNPMAIDLPSRQVLTGTELTRFRQAAGRLQSELEIEAPEQEVLNEPSYRESALGNG